MSLNKLTLIGYLGHDPEMRYTPAGHAVTTFSVAVTTRHRVDGQPQESTQWFRVSTWNRLAAVAAEGLGKGRPVYVEGPLAVRHYVGRDGQLRISLDVTARELRLLDTRHDGLPTGDRQDPESVASAPDERIAEVDLDEPPF
jgi:single-strand DNA-binding protein